MIHIERWKIILICLMTAWGVLYAMPNTLSKDNLEKWRAAVPGWVPSSTINLGLDLQGGSHLLLEVDTKATIKERLDSMVDAARTELRKQDIGYTGLGVEHDVLSFKLRDVSKDKDAAYQLLRGLDKGLDISISDDGDATVKFTEAAVIEIKGQVISHSIEIIRRRIDESGTKEPLIQRQGSERIILQLPGIEDPAHVKELLGKTAKMTFHLVDEEAIPSAGNVPPSSRLLPMLGGEDGRHRDIVIKKRVMLSGDMLVDAQASFEQGAPVVAFRFNSIGSKRFCDISRENVGHPFAIVLDDQVISAPVINEAICGGSGIIRGNFTVKEANELSLLLRAGALPAPLAVVEERTVGPSLGADSIEAGKLASIVAFVLVFTLMIMTYGLFGLFADIALCFNIIFIFAILSLLQATLTLPGIAGIILTIGIAVDANVLIYERIREEIRQGRAVISSIDTGYRLALHTIIDSNLTTLIVALILFSFGSGPVKGFAVSMCIGILTSLFSATMLTRLMIVTWLKKTRPTTLTV